MMKTLTGIEIKIVRDEEGNFYYQTATGAGDNTTVHEVVALPANIAEAMQAVLEEVQHRIYQIFLDDVAGN